MLSLEDSLNEIRKLRRNLDIKIIIRPAVTHSEWYDDYPAKYEEIVEPEISRIDTKKRNDANKRLRKIYESNEEYYSIKFAAARSLRYPLWLNDKEVKKIADDYIEQLSKEIQYTEDSTSQKRIKAINDLSQLIKEFKLEDRGGEIDDKGMSLFFRGRYSKAKTILTNIYNSESDIEVKSVAGKGLGFSKSEMFKNKHPNADLLINFFKFTFIAGASVAGAVAAKYLFENWEDFLLK